MSGYLGNPDAESEHAMILSENGIAASRAMINGPILTECAECGTIINPQRVAFMLKINMKCMYCIVCQINYDNAPKIKMLDMIS